MFNIPPGRARSFDGNHVFVSKHVTGEVVTWADIPQPCLPVGQLCLPARDWRRLAGFYSRKEEINHQGGYQLPGANGCVFSFYDSRCRLVLDTSWKWLIIRIK